MKINLNQIPSEGLKFKDKIDPAALDLDTEIIKFREPINIAADISKVTSIVIANLVLEADMEVECGRCLENYAYKLKKKSQFNYPVSKNQTVVDLDPDIREDIILEFPIKPLCKLDCKGLCPKCGQNLNEGGCSCGPT